MVKAFIVDDEPKNVKILQELLVNYCEEVEVVGSANIIQTAYNLIQIEKPDVVFLDIEMPFGNGFQLLSKFVNPDFETVFVTAHDEYAVKAFKYNVADYLLKPVNIEELQSTLKRVRDRIRNKRISQSAVEKSNNKNKSDTIKVQNNKGDIELVGVDVLVRVESQGRYCYLFSNDGRKFLISSSIKELEESLPIDQFFRVHNSSLVNRKYIVKYINGRGGEVECSDGTKIEVAARRKREFLEWLGL